jgi:hypothetical protein
MHPIAARWPPQSAKSAGFRGSPAGIRTDSSESVGFRRIFGGFSSDFGGLLVAEGENPSDFVGFRRIPADSCESEGPGQRFRRISADFSNLTDQSDTFGGIRRIPADSGGSRRTPLKSVGFSADFRRISAEWCGTARGSSGIRRIPSDSVGFRRIPADGAKSRLRFRRIPSEFRRNSDGIRRIVRISRGDPPNSVDFGGFCGLVPCLRRDPSESVGIPSDFRRIFGGCPSDEIESVGFRRNPSESVGFAAHGVGLCMGFVGFRRISSESAGIRRIPMDPPDVRRIFGGFSADFQRIFGGFSSDCMRFGGIRRNPTESVGFPPDFLRYSLAGQSQNLIPMMPAAKIMHT